MNPLQAQMIQQDDTGVYVRVKAGQKFTPVLLYIDSNSGTSSSYPLYDYRPGQSSFRSFAMVVVDAAVAAVAAVCRGRIGWLGAARLDPSLQPP